LRNAEVAFKRDLFTHAAWYDVISGKVRTADLANLPDLAEFTMEADVPWITFYNPGTGMGFGGIQLRYANAGLEDPARLLNPFFYITVGPWVYWSRALSLTYTSENLQQVVEAMRGNVFWEEWAFVVYEVAEGDEPYAPLLEVEKKVTNPLRVRVVQEVDSRVTTQPTEVYMDEEKTGWEERETREH
jgi:hypothetical protein